MVEVTNLDDDGAGSLRAALAVAGPRIVVFRISGTIELKSRLGVPHGDLTIAGQSAPGDGICLKQFGLDLSGTRNVIVRFLRVRPGNGAGVQLDAIGGRNCENVIVDHCSASWSVDETFSIYDCRALTVQWCIISESLFKSVHEKGEHGYGGIWGGSGSSWHHNLIANHTSRNPRFERDEIGVDFRNNAIFNWGFNSAYGGERSAINMVANYFQPGPATNEKVRERILDANAESGRWFVENNVVVGAADLDADNWQGGIQRPWTHDEKALRVLTSFPAAFVTAQPAAQARELVLAQAGATLPKRDSVDERVVAETRAGNPTAGHSFNGGGNGIIDSQADVGGWPELKSAPAPADSDHDGMPDDWERRFGLSPENVSDGSGDRDGDGYTNVEEFLNGTDPVQPGKYAILRELPAQTVNPTQPARFWRHEITVAADGTGDVATVQAAIDAAPTGQTKPFVIRLEPGTYREHLVVPADKPFLTFRGSSAETTIISGALNFNTPDGKGGKLTAQDSATLLLKASDFSAEKITFENTTGTGVQALAIFSSGDRVRFRNCRFLGWQDTVRLDSGRVWMRDCYIAGHVDFIYGSATAFFDRCEIHCLGDGFITAASTPREQAFGFVFQRCRITAEPTLKRTYLGRPWRDDASVTFLSCELPAVIPPEGWHNWDQPTREKTARYAEFGSTGPGANPEKRVAWSRQLDEKEARAIKVEAVLGGTDGWQPAGGSEKEAPARGDAPKDKLSGAIPADPASLPAQTQLPDLLQKLDGSPVTTRGDWETQRKPELRRLVQAYEYGAMPSAPQGFEAKLLREDKAALGGKATLREIEILCTKPDARVHLLVVIPNKRDKALPCFLGMNFSGNFTLLADPLIELPRGWVSEKYAGAPPNHATEAGRGKQTEMWAIEQSIDRGYAVATFFSGDVVPDQVDVARERLKDFRVPTAPEKAQPATLACWAWGFSRMIDYLAKDPAIDPKRIAIVGHSRNGKATLLAAAMDERVALAIPTQAGCGGTAPCRVAPELAQLQANGRPLVETIGVINKNFPHWFSDTFKGFNEMPERLPFDHHALVALCAPRPVLFSCATEDRWSNPPGQFEILRAADPVYRLVAGDSIGAQTMPEVDTLLDSRLGYYIRPGKHSMTREDWKVWLDYADKWLR